MRRSTRTAEGIYTLGYIKHDNGGGTLQCLPDGSMLTLGSEFSVTVLDHFEGIMGDRCFLDTEQATEEGWFWSNDYVFHDDQMESKGLVLTRLTDNSKRVLPCSDDWVRYYATSHLHPVAALLTAPKNRKGTDLVLLSLPDLAPFFRISLGPKRCDSLLFHPREPRLFVSLGSGSAEVRFDNLEAPAVLPTKSAPRNGLSFFNGTGTHIYAGSHVYSSRERPATIERWDVALDCVEELNVPCRPGTSGAVTLWEGDTLVCVQGDDDKPGLTLRLVE
ncbi:MAG: hypothetical protein AAFQ82_14600 [Myxococcota bacterium]